MPLIWNDDLDRFIPPDDPENWIDLKRELTSGDDDAVWEAVAKVSATSEKDLLLSVRVTALNRERVQRSIVAWSYTREGEPVAVNEDNVSRLDRKTYAALVERVDELNPLVLPTNNGSTAAVSKPGTAALRERHLKV